MTTPGQLTEWDDERGFGFITPLRGGPRVFVHISAFGRNGRRPVAGEAVVYTVTRDAQDRLRAQTARCVTQMPPRPAGRCTLRSVVGAVALALFLDAVLLGAWHYAHDGGGRTARPVPTTVSTAGPSPRLQDHTWVQQRGTVVQVLPDDNKGSRHQRFIVQLASGQCLTIAHNIDLAPRVRALRPGAEVEFYGEYVATPEGGVMHWTHHDPAGRRGGWLKVNGATYQ